MQKIERNNKIIEHLDPMCAPNLTLNNPGLSPCLCNATTPATVTSTPNKVFGVTVSSKTVYYCPDYTQK
jgi:hypothetical protein